MPKLRICNGCVMKIPLTNLLNGCLAQLYTFEEEVVLDPFMGSGQTALAAIKSGRGYVGYETNPEYVSLAEGRIREFCETEEEQD